MDPFLLHDLHGQLQPLVRHRQCHLRSERAVPDCLVQLREVPPGLGRPHAAGLQRHGPADRPVEEEQSGGARAADGLLASGAARLDLLAPDQELAGSPQADKEKEQGAALQGRVVMIIILFNNMDEELVDNHA